MLQHYQSGAQTRRVPELLAAQPEAFVEVHPDTAGRAGLRDGALARVESRRGTVTARVRCVPSLRLDTVFLPFHFPGDGAANALTNPALDPISRDARVQGLRRAPRPREEGRTPGGGQRGGGVSPVRVVVAGHGMVGARFAEEVRRHDPEGRRVRLTILAAEPRPAYNRVLLPNLLSGVMKEEDFAATVVAGLPVVTGQETSSIQNGSVLHPDAPMTLRVGTTVIGIDPVGKTVLARRAAAGPAIPWTRDRTRAGARAGTAARAGAGSRAGVADETAVVERIGYDVLVLATGARAVVPPLSGLLAGHPAGTGNGAGGHEARCRSADCLSSDVAALHSLADARRIAAFAQAARRTRGRVAVLGGGVLGLEAARALAARGTAVTVVHRGGHLMDRQLDTAAGRVLAAAMRRTGVGVSLGAGAARWEPGHGLWLDRRAAGQGQPVSSCAPAPCRAPDSPGTRDCG